MDKIDSLLLDIKKEIYSEPCVKEYFRLKDAISKDKKLCALEEEIRLHQKAMCENKDNDVVFQKEMELYNKAIVKFEANPIIKNFNVVKEEVFSLLNEVRGEFE